MTVYVDALVQHPPPPDAQTRRAGAPHGHRWCHLFCDPGDEEDLHAMAERIGMRRAWFQASPPASKPHYDLTPPRRAAALAAGAVELNRHGPIDDPLSLRAFFARWRADRLCDNGDGRQRVAPDRFCLECLKRALEHSRRGGFL